MRQPKKGAIVRWGTCEGSAPQMCAAWAPGAKGAAHVLLNLISAHKQDLIDAGVDLTTLRITAEVRGG